MLASENDWDMDVGHSWIAALATQDGHTRGSEATCPRQELPSARVLLCFSQG